MNRFAWLLVPLIVVGGCGAPSADDTGELDESEDTSEPEPVDTGPIADPGAAQVVEPGTTVVLSAAQSRDGSGRAITAYAWTLPERPSGSRAELTNAEGERASFLADVAGEYVAELTVMNEDGAWDETPARVTVTAQPVQALFVQLTWNTAVDLDLHLLREDAPLWDARGDAGYCNRAPDWGVIGQSADNPALYGDLTAGFGPEVIAIAAPVAGRYTPVVLYAGRGDSAQVVPTDFRVDVFVDGQRTHFATARLAAIGDTWEVGELSWPAGEVQVSGVQGTTPDVNCP